MQHLLPNISRIEGLRLGNIYAIKAPDGLTLIDTSTPGSLPRIAQDLEQNGYQLSDIKRILITHAHWDHYGSLAALKEVTGATIYAHHRHESAVLRGETTPLHPPYSQLSATNRLIYKYWVLPKRRHTIAVPIDHELTDGDQLNEVLPGLQVIDLPGHAPGQCGFWHPQLGILFGGDVLMRTPLGRLTLPMLAATPDLPAAKRSIHKIANLNPQILCLGHGRPLTHNTPTLLHTFTTHLRE